MKVSQDHDWHHLSTDRILDLLAGNPGKGLDDVEVRQRRDRFGHNKLTAKQGKAAWMRFLLQFHQPLIYILIAAGVITAVLQEWIDSGVIFGVVLINSIIGFIQESKAENALATLADTMVAEATVLRQGEKKRIASTDLVPGDIVLLQAGDKVPADLRMLQIRDLQVDESALTGESVAVEKNVVLLARETILAERVNMTYGSSMVTYGRGTGVVTAIGAHTEVGRISKLISLAQDLTTPLTRKITDFSQILLYAILLLAVITVAVGILRGQPLFDMFMAAVALAVGAIPEGLPAAVTSARVLTIAAPTPKAALMTSETPSATDGSARFSCCSL